MATLLPEKDVPLSTTCTSPDPHFSGEELRATAFSDADERQLAEIETYVRQHSGLSSAPDVRAEVVRQEFHRAEILLWAKRWVDAASAFREVASYDDSEYGLTAAERYLEVIDLIGSMAEPPRSECFDDMARDVPLFLSLHCSGEVSGERARACLTLFRTRQNLDRPVGCRIRELQDKPTDHYVDAWKTLARARVCCASALRFGSSPDAEHCDELAYVAGMTLLLAGHADEAREALGLLRDPKNHLERSRYLSRLEAALTKTSTMP